MSKQRMIITDDQVLIDTELLFGMIRSAGGNWQQVEKQIEALLHSAQTVTETKTEAPAAA
ncbi:hypothetical protein IJJ12_01715 [bacterium]|nr:hypothetical protein [bacterium]